MSDDLINRKLGRYEIKELIGEGAMAMVYRAYDPEINRSVACKVLKADHCVDEEYVSRFLREAKAAGALSHSSIVTVFDVGEVDDRPYIMMELLQGKDLGEVLNETKKVGVRETVTIALQLAKALSYAHSTGIVHRDVKPDNIIVLPDGETVKVADFGIARMNENEEAQKTQVGSVLGTPRYMSPEQALGNEVDGRADLFAVGAIMYEMLTGTKAFDASNMGTLMIQIAQKQPEPLKKMNPSVPTGLRQIVQKLLQKSADKRYQTGDELAQALIKELNDLRDQQEEQKKHKYIPLKIKWTLSAAAIVAAVLLVSMNVVFGLQSSAMTKQAVDSGSSFAKFIATETAIPLLSEDWITLETFINDAASRDTFSYLIVTDRTGVIRGASDVSLVGQTYEESGEVEVISKTDDVYTTSSIMADETPVFNITTPILFQDTEVGTIILGLSQQSVDEVKSVTGWLMFLLAVITISSVAVVMFIFGGLISKPLKTISRSLTSFASGDLDVRISLTRQDEIGEVFDDFNHMAHAIQERYTSVTDELAQSGIQTPADKLESSSVSHLDNQDVDDATIMASSLIAIKDQDVDDATIMASSTIKKKEAKPVTKPEAAKEAAKKPTSKSTVDTKAPAVKTSPSDAAKKPSDTKAPEPKSDVSSPKSDKAIAPTTPSKAPENDSKDAADKDAKVVKTEVSKTDSDVKQDADKKVDASGDVKDKPSAAPTIDATDQTTILPAASKPSAQAAKADAATAKTDEKPDAVTDDSTSAKADKTDDSKEPNKPARKRTAPKTTKKPKE
jgi:serine/threonine-protein kinase